MARSYVVLISLLVLTGPARENLVAQRAPAVARSEVKAIRVHSAAIARNLVNEPAEQTVLVYLPASYPRETTRRYPVIYLLHGIIDRPQTWIEGWNLPPLLDRMMEEKRMAEAIVVMPNGNNRFGGSYYRNSPVTGGWEDWIRSELVGYVDSAFRTIARRDARAITGHSMGGFGAIRIGAHAPEVFGVVYAMSPCCLDFVEDIGYGNGSAWREALRFQQLSDVDAAAANRNFYPVAAYGILAATLPAPDQPMFVKWPIQEQRGELLPDPAVWNRWKAATEVQQVAANAERLRTLLAFGMDYGINDQFPHIPPATAAFARALSEYRVPHMVEVFDGDHREHFLERLEQRVLPFISAILSRR
jgi:S-formylglutathione hydrolase